MPARASGKCYFTIATAAIKKACGISEIVKPSGDMIQDQATIPIPKTKNPRPKRAERSSIEALSALMRPNMDKQCHRRSLKPNLKPLDVRFRSEDQPLLTRRNAQNIGCASLVEGNPSCHRDLIALFCKTLAHCRSYSRHNRSLKAIHRPGDDTICAPGQAQKPRGTDICR